MGSQPTYKPFTHFQRDIQVEIVESTFHPRATNLTTTIY